MRTASLQGVVDEARRSMNALVETIGRRHGRRPASEVVVGSLLDTLIEQAAQVDLLAIGARGQHPVRDFSLGTTGQLGISLAKKALGADKVVLGTDMPVFNALQAAGAMRDSLSQWDASIQGLPTVGVFRACAMRTQPRRSCSRR